MSISSKIEELALDKSAIKAAIEAKLPDIPPTDSLSQWPTSIMSIPVPEPEPAPEPVDLYVRPSDWPDLPSILAAHPASEKGYGYAYAMLVEGRNPPSAYNYITVPTYQAGCRHYVTSWGLDEDAKSSTQTWVLSDPNIYQEFEWIIVYTDSSEDVALWGPCYYPYVFRWLLWFYAPNATITTNGYGLCGIISLREICAKRFNSRSMTFSFGRGDYFNSIEIEKYKVTDVGVRINGSFFPARLGRNIDFDIEISNTMTDIHDMFNSQYYISYIKPFSVPSSVTSIYNAFSGCISLLDIDVSGWDVRNVLNMNSLFSDCIHLKKLDLSSWDVGNATSFYRMFRNCYSIKNIDLTGWEPKNVTDTREMFYSCHSLEHVDMSGWDVSKVTSSNSMFTYCDVLKKVDSKNCVFSSSTSFQSMFYGCNSLETVDVSNWDASNVTTTSTMFGYCHKVNGLDFSKWKLGSSGGLTSISQMFINCYSLEEVDISSFNTSNVTSFYQLFNNCFMLKKINVSKLDTGKVTDMRYAFFYCMPLESIDVSEWNVGSVTAMDSMFNYCYKLKEIDVSNWDVHSLKTCGNMFQSCMSLEHVDISNWNLASITSMNYMFSDCHSLLSVKLPKMNTVYVCQFSACGKCLLYDFRLCTSVPVLSNTNAFSGINANAKIVVPDALYNSWIAASNWSNSTIKSKIISVSDYESL